MAEIVPVVSEALEAQVRNLLPSQRGFGEDLQASNVITPIIDLTAVAEGETTPEYMQTALCFGSQTPYSVTNTTTVLINTPGFYRNTGHANIGGGGNLTFNFSDGLSSKQILNIGGSTGSNYVVPYDFYIFLASGESFSATATVGQFLIGSTRQVATVDGVLVNPSGFTPQ